MRARATVAFGHGRIIRLDRLVFDDGERVVFVRVRLVGLGWVGWLVGWVVRQLDGLVDWFVRWFRYLNECSTLTTNPLLSITH